MNTFWLGRACPWSQASQPAKTEIVMTYCADCRTLARYGSADRGRLDSARFYLPSVKVEVLSSVDQGSVSTVRTYLYFEFRQEFWCLEAELKSFD
jgi:hypothetical protein